MTINTRRLIDYWLTTAKSDFETAEALFNNGKRLHHCLFFCHLVIEKYLKALVVKRIENIPPKTHDLEYLAKKATLDLSQEDLDFLTEMNQFVLEARYPDEKLEIYKKATKRLVRKYFNQTKEFTQWLEKIITS